MPMYDLLCQTCGKESIDVLMPIAEREQPCECGGTMVRAWLTKPGGVIGDDIPGGYEVKHGLCHEDGTPRKFYSKSEMARAAKERGLTNYVVHVPSPGSDKNRKGHTSRWV